MSQSTPAKQNRIERHLMRQRGAGARAVTANFGFSFEGLGLAAIAPALETTEGDDEGGVMIIPPMQAPKLVVTAEPAVERVEEVATKDDAPPKSRTSRKRKADFEDDVVNKTQKEDVDDSFDASIKSRKRPAKRAKKDTEAKALAPRKKAATRRNKDEVEKVEERVEEVVEDIQPLVAEVTKVAKKSGRVRKKAAILAESKVELVDGAVAEVSVREPVAKKQPGRSKKAEIPEQKGITAAADDVTPPSTAPVKKRVGRKQTVATVVENVENLTETVNEQALKPARRAAIKRTKPPPPTNDEMIAETEAAPANRSTVQGRKRVVADSRVNENAIPNEDDRLMLAKPREAAKSKIPISIEESQQNLDVDIIASTAKRSRVPRRKPAPTISHIPPVDNDEVDELSGDIAPSKAATTQKHRKIEDEHEEHPFPAEQQTAYNPQAHHAPKPSKPSRSKKAAPRRRGKLAMQVLESPIEPSAVASDVAAQPEQSPNPLIEAVSIEGPAEPSETRFVKKAIATERKRKDVDQTNPVVAQPEDSAGAPTSPVKKRRALAESNANRSMRSVSPDKKPRAVDESEKHAKTTKPAARKPTKPSAKALEREVPVVHPPTPPASQDVNSKDDKDGEDIDWLFAPHERTAPTVRPASRATKPKATTASKKMADLDLDDLLSNIATFAGKCTAESNVQPAEKKQRVTKRR